MANSRQLAMRDPALAALVGALSGADFGAESSFGAEAFGEDYSEDPDLDGSFGEEFGEEFGEDFGEDDFGAAPATRPSPAAAMALWNARRRAHALTLRRVMRLYPNKGSSLKLEQMSFPLNPATNPTIGTAVSPLNMTNNPDVTLRPERISFNVPSAAMYIVSEVKTSNIGVLVGGAASQDAFFFNPQSVGMRLSCPTLGPSNRLTIVGAWLNLVPPGFVNGAAFPLSAIATGPAKMAG